MTTTARGGSLFQHVPHAPAAPHMSGFGQGGCPREAGGAPLRVQYGPVGCAAGGWTAAEGICCLCGIQKLPVNVSITAKFFDIRHGDLWLSSTTQVGSNATSHRVSSWIANCLSPERRFPFAHVRMRAQQPAPQARPAHPRAAASAAA